MKFMKSISIFCVINTCFVLSRKGSNERLVMVVELLKKLSLELFFQIW